MDHCQFRSLLTGGVRDILAPAHHHHMAAGGFLHMEPEVFAPGGVQGKAVVLGVVAPHQDLESIRGGKAQEVRRFLPLIPLLVIFQVSLAFQLCPDLPQSCLTGKRTPLRRAPFPGR